MKVIEKEAVYESGQFRVDTLIPLSGLGERLDQGSRADDP